MSHESSHTIIHKLKAVTTNPKVQKYGGFIVAFIAGAIIF